MLGQELGIASNYCPVEANHMRDIEVIALDNVLDLCQGAASGDGEVAQFFGGMVGRQISCIDRDRILDEGTI